jgi:hypothetical protein
MIKATMMKRSNIPRIRAINHRFVDAASTIGTETKRKNIKLLSIEFMKVIYDTIDEIII